MGYRSCGTMGIQTKVLNRCKLLDQNVPSLLDQMKEDTLEEVTYFTYIDWKMYESYPDVSAFMIWLEWLDNEYEDEDPVYGYLEVGEEGETSSMGDPCDYEIYVNHTIESPI